MIWYVCGLLARRTLATIPATNEATLKPALAPLSLGTVSRRWASS